MAYSETTVMYGLVVKTWHLLVAAKAFSELFPILLTLDRIIFKKKAGKLTVHQSVAQATNFGDLPVEVFEIIKKKVVELRLMQRAATKVILEHLKCFGAVNHTQILKDKSRLVNWRELKMCVKCQHDEYEPNFQVSELDDLIRDVSHSFSSISLVSLYILLESRTCTSTPH